MKILLVSSSPRVTRQVTAALLDRPGVDVTVHPTPRAALAALDDDGDAYDVVVADNDTHPAGGLFLAREIQARVGMGASMPPVVLLLARRQDAWLARWSGAHAFTRKPVDPFDLVEALDRLVAGEPLPALPDIEGPGAPLPAAAPVDA